MAATVSLIQDRHQGYNAGAAVPWQAGTLSVLATALMSDADASDPTKTCAFGMEFSFDGGATFGSPSYLNDWSGGLDPLHGNAPALPKVGSGFSAAGVAPTHVRVFVDCPLPLSIGGQVSFS